MSRPPERGGTGQVIVHLSQIPTEVRLKAAHRLIRVEGIVAEAALELMLAAVEPRHDPWVAVDVEHAVRVLG